MRIVLVLGLVLAGLACDKTIEEAARREGISPMQMDRSVDDGVGVVSGRVVMGAEHS